MLKLILSELDVTKSFDAAVWAAHLIMFYGLLRKSNVIVTSQSSFDPDKHLCRQDVLIHHWGIALIIRWSKTNQFKSKTIKIPLPRSKGNQRQPLCPVQAIVNSFQLSSGALPEGPTLMYYVHAKLAALTYDRFLARIRQVLSGSSLDGSQVGCHS